MRSEDHTEHILRRISQWSFFITAVISFVSLLAWFFGLFIVVTISPAYIPIAPSTALCFMVLSVSLLAHALAHANGTRRMIAVVGACLTLLINLVLLAGFFLKTTLEVEHLGFPLPPDAKVSAGHMSPITAFTFFMVAAGILLFLFSDSRRQRFKQVAAFIAAAVSLVGLIVILGYLHGTPLLYEENIIPVALTTAIAFVFLGVGLITAAGPSVLFVRVFVGSTVRSQLMRSFLPAVTIFVLIDGLMYRTTLAKSSNPALIASLIALVSILVVVMLISKIAKSIGDEIDREHAERLRVEDEVGSLASIIQNIPTGVCAMDTNGVVISWNRGAENMLGYTSEEIVGRPMATLLPKEIAAKELDHCMNVLNADGAFSGYESVRIAKDGRTVPVELTGVAIKDAAQTIRSYASVMVDITNRKISEEERLKGHMLESIGLLAGGIAHDFNNLLTVILSDINIARMYISPEDKAFSRLADAEQVCIMASELSKRLLTFATGGDPVKKTISMSGLLTSAVSAFLKHTDISPEFDLPDDLYTVAIDEEQMKQVIQNLVLNAKEAMPHGGTLAVRGENLRISAQDGVPMREGHYLKISIRDTGSGIPAENLAKIFDPYFSTKDTFNQKGLGLGLAVCYSVIKRHDGLITVESEVGKGTSYHIYLPAVGYK